MKYTIELTDNQKGQMDLLIEMAHKHVGFNPKLEPMETTSEYQIGYNEGLVKQSDPNFVPLQRCPVKLEDCRAYKLGLEDGNKIADKDLKEIQDSTYDVAYNKGIEDLTHAMKVYFPLNSEERLEHFGTNIHTERYAIENPKDLIAMAKAYEEKKKAEEFRKTFPFKLGDVAVHKEKPIMGIVIGAWQQEKRDDNWIDGVRIITRNTEILEFKVDEMYKAEGRHYDIESILKELGE